MSHLTGADCALDVVKLFLQYHAMLLFFFLIWEKKPQIVIRTALSSHVTCSHLVHYQFHSSLLVIFRSCFLR